MNESFMDTYFVDGGTLRPNTPSYVTRPADDELFEALLSGEYCYVLTPRQMGKSSLMIHTSQRLKEHNVKSAIVDIQRIGTNKVKEWYASMLSQIRRGLKLSVDIDDWMKRKSNIGYGELFVEFIQDVVLVEIQDRVVIFFDEVDWMIKLDFRDDFFASIRSIYNARAQYAELGRISFVLLGVASPADLIAEPTRTPFNIGHAILLQELSFEDADPLQIGLERQYPDQSRRILDRIFYWTSGHPYLTQRLCKTIAESEKPGWSDEEIDQLVHKLFLADESRKEGNLKFIQDRILSNEQHVELLHLYKRSLKSKVRENGQSIPQNQLMLSGLLTSRNGHLEVRNRIYRTVFNERWIIQNTPKNWQRIAILTLAAIVTLLLAVFSYDFAVGMWLDGYTADFYRADSPTKRLSQLANIYGSRGILSNTDTALSASQLFYGLRRDEQLSIFTDYEIEVDPKLQDDLVTVVSHLYITVANVDPDTDNTELLQTMRNSLDKVKNNSEKDTLITEISSWLRGRQNYRDGNYSDALQDYTNAIEANRQNPATVFERAMVYIVLEDYQSALQDLESTISLAKESTQQDVIDLTPTVTATLNLPPTSSPAVSTVTPAESIVIPSTKSPSATPFLNLSTPSPVPNLPTITPTAPANERFESNFSTFIEIVSAVRTLIEQTSELESAIQEDGGISYTNLQSVGLITEFVTASPTEVSATEIPPGELTGTLTVLDWAGYDAEDFWIDFKNTYPNVTVNFEIGSSDADIYAKMAAGNQADVFHPYTGWWQLFVDEGLVEEIDTSKLSNWDKVPDNFKRIGQINGKQYFIPWDWGFASILYRTDNVSEGVDSWEALMDPKYAGHISIWDDGPEAVKISSYIHGYDETAITVDQLASIKEEWIAQRDLNLFYWAGEPELMEGMRSGDVWLAYAWQGAYATLLGEGVPVAYANPKEGRNIWVGAYGIRKGTENYDLALKFLDEKLAEATGNNVVNLFYYGHTNQDVMNGITDEMLRQAFSIDDPTIFATANFSPSLTVEQRDAWTAMWAEVKAAP